MRVLRTTPRLEWRDFVVVPVLHDPLARRPVDALTDFYVRLLGDEPVGAEGGGFRLAEDAVLRLAPLCRRVAGAPATAALLAHEQGHWDIAFLVGGSCARRLAGLHAGTADALREGVTGVLREHFVARNEAIQARYDRETGHGRDEATQRRWAAALSQALASNEAGTLEGLPL